MCYIMLRYIMQRHHVLFNVILHYIPTSYTGQDISEGGLWPTGARAHAHTHSNTHLVYHTPYLTHSRIFKHKPTLKHIQAHAKSQTHNSLTHSHSLSLSLTLTLTHTHTHTHTHPMVNQRFLTHAFSDTNVV